MQPRDRFTILNEEEPAPKVEKPRVPSKKYMVLTAVFFLLLIGVSVGFIVYSQVGEPAESVTPSQIVLLDTSDDPPVGIYTGNTFVSGAALIATIDWRADQTFTINLSNPWLLACTQNTWNFSNAKLFADIRACNTAQYGMQFSSLTYTAGSPLGTMYLSCMSASNTTVKIALQIQ